ncbi:MAG: alpha/beta hydrolase [Pirellulales bacterium]|nr:alpha/beta hydrolase [Pirellulales bacterium]
MCVRYGTIVVWVALVTYGISTWSGCGAQNECARDTAAAPPSEVSEENTAPDESAATALPKSAPEPEPADSAPRAPESVDPGLSYSTEQPPAEPSAPAAAPESLPAPEIRMLAPAPPPMAAVPDAAPPEAASQPYGGFSAPSWEASPRESRIRRSGPRMAVAQPDAEAVPGEPAMSAPAAVSEPAPAGGAAMEAARMVEAARASESMGSAQAAPAPPPPPLAPAESAANPPPSSPKPPTEDYATVTVFYGTDRLALGPDAATGPWNRRSLFAAGICVAITLVVTLLALRLSRRRLAVGFGIMGGLASVTLVSLSSGIGRSSSTLHPGPTRVYGNQRGAVELGTCQVSIPKRHEVGQVERPSIFRLEFEEDPTRHVVLLDVVPEPEPQFYARLSDRIQESPKNEALVFVHGFNVTFEAAARRTAQLAYDLKFQGAPIFFSWPSQGGLLQYTVDETNVIWAVPHLKEFLLGIVQKSKARSVHLVAHSMGNRALTAALQTIAYEFKDSPPMFNQVVLTAPDIDADVFRRDIAPAIVKTAGRVTLYASSNDEALVLSKQIHGYPRAGDSGEGLLIIPGVDTIDVSTIDTSLIGHSYYGSNSTVLEDLLDLLHESKPPDQRPWLHPMQLGRLMYWVFLAEKNRLESAAAGGAVSRQ